MRMIIKKVMTNYTMHNVNKLHIFSFIVVLQIISFL